MASSAKNKIFAKPTAGFKLVDKLSAPASTTLSAAVAAGASTFDVTSATGITAGKWIRLGEGEYAEPVLVSSVSSTTITPTRPVMIAHDSGDAVVEQTAFDLGQLSGQVGVSINGESTDFEVETRRLIYATLPGFVDMEAALNLVGLTPYTLAIALGISLSNVYGSRTSTAPLALTTDGSEIGGDQNQFVIIQGVRTDGTLITIELWGASNDYTGVSLPMSRGQALTVPCKWLAPRMIIDEAAAAYTGASTATSDAGDLLDSLQEVGFFEPATTGALSTTLSAGPAAGTQSISLASVTNLAAGNYLKLGTGKSSEIHRVNNPATTTLVTKLYRAFASGAAAVKQKQTRIGGIVKGSVNFSVGGSIEKIQLEDSTTTVGIKAGSAQPQMTFTIADFIVSVIFRAAAAAQSGISSSKGVLDGSNIGKSPIDAMYLIGKNGNAETVLFVLTGCSQLLQNINLAMTKSGVNGIPFNVRPGSTVQLQVYS